MTHLLTRRTLLGITAVAAGIAGITVASDHMSIVRKTVESSSSPIWHVQTHTPHGGLLMLSDFRGKPMVVNFWATWCPPCVEELPLLNAFYRAHKREVNVLGLAADQPTSVTQFLRKLPLEFPVGVMGLEGTTLSRQLGNERGGLPFTVAFDRQGDLVQRKIGQITSSDLDQWLSVMR